MQTSALLAITATCCPVLFDHRQKHKHNSQLVFFELTVTDLVRAKSFYGHLLGWTFSDSPSPDFVSIKGAGVPGGILRDANKKPGNGDVKVFFTVEDISAILERAKQLGADVLVGETHVSPTRTLAEFRDPDGNAIGIMHEVGAPRPTR